MKHEVVNAYVNGWRLSTINTETCQGYLIRDDQNRPRLFNGLLKGRHGSWYREYRFKIVVKQG